MPRLLDSLLWPFTVFGLLCLIAWLVGCTPQQQGRASGYQQKIAFACGVAMGLAPIAGPYAPWIIGACSSEELIARLALDPDSLVWLDGLIEKARGA